MKTQNNSNDPRIKRTRQLIVEAFISLVNKKSFESITIKDISQKATINRATFYAHFQDKYDLFDYSISENLNKILNKNVDYEAKLDEKFIKSLIISVCEYHQRTRNTCQYGYKSISSIMDTKSKEILTDILYNKLKQYNCKKAKLLAIMISNSISSSVCEWNSNSDITSSEMLVDEILPFIMSGIEKMLQQ